jgi:hypothetical protein
MTPTFVCPANTFLRSPSPYTVWQPREVRAKIPRLSESIRGSQSNDDQPLPVRHANVNCLCEVYQRRGSGSHRASAGSLGSESGGPSEALFFCSSMTTTEATRALLLSIVQFRASCDPGRFLLTGKPWLCEEGTQSEGRLPLPGTGTGCRRRKICTMSLVTTLVRN